MKKLSILMLAMLAVSAFAAPPKPAKTDMFKPLEYKGKPIFVLGNWDSRRENNYKAVHPMLQGAGMNSMIIGLRFCDDKHLEHDMSVVRWFRDNHPEVAMILDLELDFILTSRESATPVSAAELPARRAKFTKVLKELRTYGNVFGYTIDELENRVYKTLAQWRQANNIPADETDTALTRYMEAAIGWMTEDIKKYHPEAIYMPVQAWWTTYAQSDKLFDVLIANQYPVAGKVDYTVAYDAQLAADATRKLGKRCFLYCPPGFNILQAGVWKDAPSYTREELRYYWFTPISYGAMGIMGWRHRRTTHEFARDVLFPVMNEVKTLTPWFLGENIDRLVSTADDNKYIEYKVPIRSKMTDDEDNKFHIRPVKAFSWIARKNPVDGSVLLLVANNSDKPAKTIFVFDRGVKIKYAIEVFSGLTTGLGRKLHVDMKPFSVKAYILPDADRQNK